MLAEDLFSMTFILDASNIVSLIEYLDEPIFSALRIGDGNMNMTVRVRAAAGSFILKQALPYVVKYPHIPAPVERASVEAAFYRVIADSPEVASSMPMLFSFDAEANLLRLEDLGDNGDFMHLYRRGKLSEETCRELTRFLRRLHAVPISLRDTPVLANRAMRNLNHQHQYELPMRTEGARRLRANPLYCERIEELGALYLADGPVLLHGDFFPGSWIATPQGLRIIDPEFCFPGPREYDLGVFLAHLEFIRAHQLWEVVMDEYGDGVDWRLARRFAGAEIMRRSIGVAQLPFAPGPRWLNLSKELVCAD
jgi:5-methylthioribose kinase